MNSILSNAFYARPTLDVVPDLIGKVLVHITETGTTAGIIVEVEAYIGEGDPACHAASGLTRRNAPMYGQPGRAYVYLNYGIHHLINVVTECEGSPAAVLLRALEPCEGIPLMRRRRSVKSSRRLSEHELCNGPGNLTCSLGITLEQNCFDLCGDLLFIEDRGNLNRELQWSERIGIKVGKDLLWRCYASKNQNVSRR